MRDAMPHLALPLRLLPSVVGISLVTVSIFPSEPAHAQEPSPTPDAEAAPAPAATNAASPTPAQPPPKPPPKPPVAEKTEAPAALRMTASHFLAEVGRRHPALAVTAADVAVAEARVRGAGLWENPTLSYDREEVFDAGDGLAENTFRVDFPLDVSGRRGLRVESAKRGVEASRMGAKARRVALLSDAMRLYVSALATRERVRVLEDSRQSLGNLLVATAARSSAGDASTYDRARIEIEIDTLDDELRSARGAWARARLELGAMMGKPGTAIEVEDTLQALPGASTARPSDDHPRLAAATSRIAGRESAASAASRGWVPDIVLSGGAKSAPGTDGTAWGYVAGISLSVPLFDRGQAGEEKARAELTRARAERALVAGQIASAGVVAQQERARTQEQLERYERVGLARVEKLRRIAEISYREGEHSVFELIDAHRAHREAQLRLVVLRFRARLSDIDWLEAQGREPGVTP